MRDDIAETMLKLLNQLLEEDSQAVNTLFGGRVICNEKVANHISIDYIRSRPALGLLSIINGLLASLGNSKLAECLDRNTSSIVGFTYVQLQECRPADDSLNSTSGALATGPDVPPDPCAKD